MKLQHIVESARRYVRTTAATSAADLPLPLRLRSVPSYLTNALFLRPIACSLADARLSVTRKADRALRSTQSSLSIPTAVIIVYAVCLTLLVRDNESIPSRPATDTLYPGINISRAWIDLMDVSKGYHPYNSKFNDEVRSGLLSRISGILDANKASYTVEKEVEESNPKEASSVIVFDDLVYDATYFGDYGIFGSPAVYMESKNVLVYIRGSEDGEDDWWRSSEGQKPPSDKHGLLAACHLDSVNSGRGADDNGYGCIVLLQLLSHFTLPGNQPKKGIVLLWDNGEEDLLNGAKIFTQHPISRFPDVFLNLEGGGVAGKAVLTRSTDVGITLPYRSVEVPYGLSIIADAYPAGLVRSLTDLDSFTDDLGLRGSDLVAVGGRWGYHTPNDGTQTSSKDTLWHMITSALQVVREVTINPSQLSESTEPAVFFDILGKKLFIFSLTATLRAQTALIAAGPFALGLLLLALNRSQAAFSVFFTYPVAFAVAFWASAGAVWSAAHFNPYIVYDNIYAVGGLVISVFLTVFWYFCKKPRTTEDERAYRASAFGWITLTTWIMQIGVLRLEKNFNIGSGFIVNIFLAGTLFALLTSCLELFTVRGYQSYITLDCEQPQDDMALNATEKMATVTEKKHASESSIVNGSEKPAAIFDLSCPQPTNSDTIGFEAGKACGEPSKKFDYTLPKSSYSGNSTQKFLQLFAFASLVLLLIGEPALTFVGGINQTPVDGNSVTPIYAGLFLFVISMVVPSSALLHSFRRGTITLLATIAVILLIYNTTRFPFSGSVQFRAYWKQTLDLDDGNHKVYLTGLSKYTELVTTYIPSAQVGDLTCQRPANNRYARLKECTWSGLEPNPMGDLADKTPIEDWVTVDVCRSGTDEGTFKISAKNTRACRIYFDQPVAEYTIEGASTTNNVLTRYPPPENPNGARELRLWRRDFDKPWIVHVKWRSDTSTSTIITTKWEHQRQSDTFLPDTEIDSEAYEPPLVVDAPDRRPLRGVDPSDRRLPTQDTGEYYSSTNPGSDGALTGTVVCMWSDANTQGVVPAFDEMLHFMPYWSSVAKQSDGFVEGIKSYSVSRKCG